MMLKWKGAALSEKLAKAQQETIQECIDRIAVRSAENVPVVTGKLKASQVSDVDETGGAIGYTAEYAVDVHENPHSDGYKFLERAVQESIGEIQMILAKMREKVK